MKTGLHNNFFVLTISDTNNSVNKFEILPHHILFSTISMILRFKFLQFPFCHMRNGKFDILICISD